MIFQATEELVCPDCKKPYTFRRNSPDQFELHGCSCNPPKKPNELPTGAIIYDLSGLPTLRVPKNS